MLAVRGQGSRSENDDYGDCQDHDHDAHIEEIGSNVRCTVLSASEPYAVTGVTTAFGSRPDLVTGLATSTTAGIELIEKLSGIKGLNVLDQSSLPQLRAVLKDTLDI